MAWHYFLMPPRILRKFHFKSKPRLLMHRIEIYPHPDVADTRGNQLTAQMAEQFAITRMTVVDVYTTNKPLNDTQRHTVTTSLTNPVSQTPIFQTSNPHITTFDYALEIGFLPGVTDNVGFSAKEIIEDALRVDFSDAESVHSSQLYLISGTASLSEIQQLAQQLANPLIQRIHIKSAAQFANDNGMDAIAPRVELHDELHIAYVDLDVSEAELLTIGTKGIQNADGSYRGPLGLSLPYMQAIQAHFATLGRKATDIELETLAQTWSEHCKHTIFADPIDDIKDGLYKHYIKRATQEIRKRNGVDDFCISVFSDNAGAITFNDEWLVTDKAETHNSPSALDPFGGAITGIVGVNRDAMGFGMGSKPILNRYGYCFSDPREAAALYRDKLAKSPTLPPRFIMDGVIHGVNVGGNCSGIPTPQGFAYFDERYGGKPLVFVGTIGLIPRHVNGKPSHEKSAQAGDKIVMIGGRVGKDGIHGATFSSVALDEGSPATAVQIGDPITQKKMSDAIIKEARDLGLYSAITDNGAGGLSSSIGEMARDSNGFALNLDDVPVKYPGMSAWEIWISESQERMTLAVPACHVEQLIALMKTRDVEATVVGEFTDSGYGDINWKDQRIMHLAMDFLHDGLPPRPMQTEIVPTPHHQEFGPHDIRASVTNPSDQDALLALLASPNIASKAFIATQYDHEVQASSVLKPLQGKGSVFADATAARPLLDSLNGVVLSQGLVPRYSDIDCYQMAGWSMDMAIRQNVAAGGNPDHMALMDNFCWCSSNDPKRLYQLKEAVRSCYEHAIAYGAPFISGKDSMFNDFNGFDADGNPITISVPPTLLISSLSVIPDVTKTASLDFKQPGDLIYRIGHANDQLDGSEYERMQGRIGNILPKVNADSALTFYQRYYQIMEQGLIASSIAVNIGGMSAALAKSTMGGMLGAHIDTTLSRAQLFSETNNQMLVSIAPQHQERFETLMGSDAQAIGVVTKDATLTVNNGDIALSLDQLCDAYRGTFAGY